MGEMSEADQMGGTSGGEVDQLAQWRADIPANIKAGGWHARYWRLALKLGRLPTLSEELDSGIRDGGWK